MKSDFWKRVGDRLQQSEMDTIEQEIQDLEARLDQLWVRRARLSAKNRAEGREADR